jgi:peptide-methionine (S)-S-oxide reductase
MKTSVLAAVAVAGVFAASAAPAAKGLKTAVFAGGQAPNPTYEDHRGYLEAVKVTYDPAKISYAQLVDYYFHHIDPTDPTGQICDKGPSYMTAVFAGNAEERKIAEETKARVAQALGARVTTVVRGPGMFYNAEGYHQDFAKRNPARYEAYRIGCGRDRVLRVVWGGR